MKRTSKGPAAFKGQRWRNTHQATVDAVLGPNVRSVVSRGARFLNRDGWTARAFMAAMCEWAKLNPSLTPGRRDVEGWVAKANASVVHNPGITIASTPDDLYKKLAYALVGGGYHEAWHTKYSRRTRIHINEVWPKVLDHWTAIPYDPANGHRGWAPLTGMLLHWDNLIDDVRIERRGCEDFPGALNKMECLQDLILEQEEEGRLKAGKGGKPAPQGAMSVVMGVFRDLGLGYTTPLQVTALKGYKEANPAGYLFVERGPLRPLMDRAIDLPAEPDLSGMWLAMEVVALIAETAVEPPKPKPEPKPNKGDEGDEGDEGSEPGEGEDEGEGGGSAEPEQEGEGGGGPSSKHQVFKVGDRATLKAGPHKGREVEVIRAGLPDNETGVQDLEFALVEPD